MASEIQDPAPSQLAGGCLCTAVRYAVTFDSEHPWPPEANACHCTMCRKSTGALIANFLTVNPAQVEWHSSSSKSPGEPATPYREYQSSPGMFRGFCPTCGSTLFWREAAVPKELEICLGSIDENWLIGKKAEGGEGRTGGFGKVLGTPAHHFWFQNAIPGVTDEVKGGEKKMLEGSALGKTMG